MNFVIVTGLSGAGKSMAVNALEDIGFFCIDNIPAALLPRIVDFALQGENQLSRVAVVMDVRGVRSGEELNAALADLDAKKIAYDILFLDAITAQMQDFLQRRRDKQPLEWPSAGSTFKRPQGAFAGKLIEDCGLRGLQVGGAQISEKHCGFVINRGGATCADVLALTEQVKRVVREKTGFVLEREIRVVK